MFGKISGVSLSDNSIDLTQYSDQKVLHINLGVPVSTLVRDSNLKFPKDLIGRWAKIGITGFELTDPPEPIVGRIVGYHLDGDMVGIELMTRAGSHTVDLPTKIFASLLKDYGVTPRHLIGKFGKVDDLDFSLFDQSTPEESMKNDYKTEIRPAETKVPKTASKHQAEMGEIISWDASEYVDSEYEEDESEAWEEKMVALTAYMDSINPSGKWFVRGSKLGWRKKSGSKDVDATTAASLLDQILPKTDNTFKVYKANPGLRILNSNHDAMGEIYDVKPRTDAEQVDLSFEEGQ